MINELERRGVVAQAGDVYVVRDPTVQALGLARQGSIHSTKFAADLSGWGLEALVSSIFHDILQATVDQVSSFVLASFKRTD